MTISTAEQELTDMVQRVMQDLPMVEQHGFGSQRTTADWVEHLIRERLIALDQGFKPPVGPRSPGDVMWHNYHINIKSTDLGRDFHMPNLISSENLWRLLQRGDHFMLLRLTHRAGQIHDWHFANIQDINWDSLQIGALGTGQLQIRDATKTPGVMQDREQWRHLWRRRMIDFYQREQTKIARRLEKWQDR